MYKKLTCEKCRHENHVEITTRKETSSGGDTFNMFFLFHCYTGFIFYLIFLIFKIAFENLGEVKDSGFSAPREEQFNCKKCKAKLHY